MLNQIQILYNVYKFCETVHYQCGKNFLGNKVVEEFAANANAAFVRNADLAFVINRCLQI